MPCACQGNIFSKCFGTEDPDRTYSTLTAGHFILQHMFYGSTFCKNEESIVFYDRGGVYSRKDTEISGLVIILEATPLDLYELK